MKKSTKALKRSSAFFRYLTFLILILILVVSLCKILIWKTMYIISIWWKTLYWGEENEQRKIKRNKINKKS